MSGIGPTLDSVPDDVVLEIWSHLEDPVSLSQVSKRFHAFSKLAFLRARWFSQRFPPYLVLFEAIARPKLLDEDLLARIIRAGAPYSRTLALLILFCTSATLCRAPLANVGWARTLPFGTYVALINMARDLYGSTLSLQYLPRDDFVLEQWAGLQQWPQEGDAVEEVPPHIVALLSDFKTMPLPLRVHDDGGSVARSGMRRVEDTLLRAPYLAPFYFANGYRATEESSLYISQKLLWHRSDEASRAAEKMRELQDQSVICIPRALAVKVFALFKLDLTVASREDRANQRRVMQACETLKHLSPHLNFDLEAVVKEAFDGIKHRLTRSTDIPLLQVIERDYPKLDVRFAYVQAMFLKASFDHQPVDLDSIAAMMGRHEVYSSDVLQACLRQDCKSVMPFRYAARFVKGFQLEPVLIELVEAILHQPYRGLVLRMLYWLCAPAEQGFSAAEGIDFPSLLAQAVERKAFTADQLPAQLWTKSFSANTNNEAARREEYACNEPSPVRSLLSFSWKSTRKYHCDDGRGVDHPDIANGPTKLRSFTRFIPLHASRDVSQVFFEEKHHQEVWQGRYSEDDSVALAIVDLLGPQSRAADVVLSHSFLNTNDALTERLLKLGVSLTLAHIKIALQVGRRLSSSVYAHMAYGAAFKSSFDSPDGYPDRILESELASTELTEEETSRCLAAAREPEEESRVLVNVDESGKLSIQQFDDAQDSAHVEKIATRASSATATTHLASALAAAEPPADAIINHDASEFLVHLDRVPTLVTKSRLIELIQSVRLWVRHLERLKQTEDKKCAALRIALRCSNPSEDFYKVSSSKTAATGQVSKIVSVLESWIQTLRNATPIDRLEPTLFELASLYDELGEAEGVEAVQRTRAFITPRLSPESHVKISRDYRRRSYTRAIHAIRRVQDSWTDILAKAQLPPSSEDLLDADFKPEEESDSSSSESEGQDSGSESRPKRVRAVPPSRQPSSSSTSTPDGSVSAQAGLLTRRRAREQSQQQAVGLSSSSHRGSCVGLASNSLAEQQHPVYAHPLFSLEEFERLSSQASEVGQRQEITEDLYEKTLMEVESFQRKNQGRWGPPSEYPYSSILDGPRFDSDISFVPHWLPPNLRADIYRKRL